MKLQEGLKYLNGKCQNLNVLDKYSRVPCNHNATAKYFPLSMPVDLVIDFFTRILLGAIKPESHR